MEQKKRATKKQEPEEQIDETEAVSVDTSGVDDLLDEIDSVLEENAEEFVKGYIQKGGQ